jgi:hypothetical protein
MPESLALPKLIIDAGDKAGWMNWWPKRKN